MIFKTYNSATVTRVTYKAFFYGNLFLALISLYGLVSGAGVGSTFAGITFLLLVALLSRNIKFRKSPFSILYCFFTLIYLNIPTAYILIKGTAYIFGEGLPSIPFNLRDYQQSLPFGFLYLSLCWFAIWLGIISVKSKCLEINGNRFILIKLPYVLLLGMIVLLVTFIDNQSFVDVRLEREGRVNSMLAFLFFDHAYLVMAGTVLFFKLNESKYLLNPKKVTILISAIFVGFTLLAFLGGSKAAILVIFMLFLLFPFSCLKQYTHSIVSFPFPKYIVGLMFLSIPLFFMALIQRLSVGMGVKPDIHSLLKGISEIKVDMLNVLLDQVFYRLAQGGMDRFLLVFQSFIVNSFDADVSSSFLKYLSLNTLNLLLPGTPFPDYFAPSSQLFSQVIEYNMVGGDIDAATFMLVMNTQPYTIFGIFIIIFSFAAPVFLYTFTLCYLSVYNWLNNIFLKLSMIYFFSAALSSYGIEVVLGNTVHLYVSIIFLFFLVVKISYLHNRFYCKAHSIPVVPSV